MKIKILKENLKLALSACERITKKATSLPILNNILLKVKGNFLEITSTNLNTTLQWWILTKVEKEGVTTIPANFFLNFINLISDNKLEIESKNNNIFIISENQKNQIQGQNPDEFPIIPKIEKDISYELPTSFLKEGLEQVIEIPSPSQIRPEISGIYFSFKKGNLSIASTDSFRLGEKKIKIKEFEKDIDFIIPQEGAREILNILSQVEEENFKCYPTSNQILFEFLSKETSRPQINIISRLIEGEYPNYQDIIPKKTITKIQVKKEEFKNQIKKAGLFSGKIMEVKLTSLPKEKKLKIFSQSPEIGENEAKMPSIIEGEEVEVSFNYKFLIDGLNNLKSSEIILELSADDGPGILKPVGDDSYLYILMPVKSS